MILFFVFNNIIYASGVIVGVTILFSFCSFLFAIFSWHLTVLEQSPFVSVLPLGTHYSDESTEACG